MTIQEAIRLGNKIRRQCWHPDNHRLIYEGSTFLDLSIDDILAYDWESEVVELPRLQRCDESGNLTTEAPEGKKWCSRRGRYIPKVSGDDQTPIQQFVAETKAANGGVEPDWVKKCLELKQRAEFLDEEDVILRKELADLKKKLTRNSEETVSATLANSSKFPKCQTCGVNAEDKFDEKYLIENGSIGDIEWYCCEACATELD